MRKEILTHSGTFTVGCNYWASHAGTRMWADWDPDVVRADFQQFSEHGLETLRVFPLWPDFQPLIQTYGGGGRPHDLRFGEKPLPHTPAGRAGVSEAAMEQFSFLADVAEKAGLQLIVGLVTGWMSGRLYVPPAFERLNVLTDPYVRRWTLRFVRYFVSQMKSKPAINAWDLGNECNCMGKIDSSHRAYEWTAAISSAIRCEDPDRPIVSGMHSLASSADGIWRIQDQSELTDILTTHPYPIFTPHCNQEPVDTIRNAYHATAESRLYADIGDVPCFAEELGTLGPMVADEEVASRYLNNTLCNLWAHDCRGMLWWCGYDQNLLTHAPYDWNGHERELGLFRNDRTPKPMVKTIDAFMKRLAESGVGQILKFQTDAVCILTEGSDQWGVAFSSFILAKQAGFDIEYQFADQPLKDASLYIVPSVAGARNLDIRFQEQLLQRVQNGASLFVSYDGAFLSPFADVFGVSVESRSVHPEMVSFTFEEDSLSCHASTRVKLNAAGSEALACETDGNPVFTKNAFGNGWAYFLSVPVERHAANTPDAFLDDRNRLYKLYAAISERERGRRSVQKSDPCIGLTEHPLETGKRMVVAANNSPKLSEGTFDLAAGWSIADTLIGSVSRDGRYNLQPNDGAVFTVVRAGATP